MKYIKAFLMDKKTPPWKFAPGALEKGLKNLVGKTVTIYIARTEKEEGEYYDRL